jgi:hypothetical protein
MDTSASLPKVTCTFGYYNQAELWLDHRTLPWRDLTTLLTSHEVGPKEGSCIVPASFRRGRRKKEDAERIDVAILDSDAGHTLEEIQAAIARWNWAAVIASTHSHGTTHTKVKRESWDKFRLAYGDASAAAAAFLRGKGYLPRVVEGAHIVEETDEYVVFEHEPCPKFRIAVPLLRPWLAASYTGQRAANAAWKERIEALAAALGLQHDQACTDTSRVFFLPRRPADAPSPETAVLEGRACDLFGLPEAPSPEGTSATKARSHGRGRKNAEGAMDDLSYVDPKTGEVLDLRPWARCLASRFEIVAALRARKPDVFTGKVADGTRHHLRCINEAAHTQAGTDASTFVANASESTHRSFVVHCRHAHCDGRDRLLFLRQMLEEGWLGVGDLTDPEFLLPEDKVKPVIEVLGGDIPHIVDQAERALLRAGLDLYQRGPFIVRPGTTLVRVAREREIVARQIFEVEEHALAEAMTRAADWVKRDERRKEPVAIDAPLKVAHTYRQRKGAWQLPVLSGLINAPTLRRDGSVLAAPGYDPATGLLLETGSLRFPDVPEAPDWEEGREAISILMQLIETFPFAGEADRSVALSTILTACVRRSLPTAPLHAFTAPVMGSGKSKLVDLACVIATGREAAVMSQGKTEEEFEKRLGALLLAGETVIPIDNCEAPLGGEFLCTVLTQTVARTRILGRSEAPELPTDTLMTATGNNLLLVGDMTRRSILCRLDPQCERPELRSFASDPVDIAKAERPRFLIAALTALRAYHVAGRPQQAEPLGSFGMWSRTVRDTLLWLGLADPVETMEALRGTDPQLDALVAVIEQWSAVLGSRKVSVREVVEAATEQMPAGGTGSFPASRLPFRYPDFREALLTVAGDNGVVNSRRLGKWLGGQQGRIVQNWRFVRLGMNAGNLQWQLQPVQDQRAAA